jgi:hypothetical protein
VLQGLCVRVYCEKGQFGHEHESNIYVVSRESHSEQYGLDERRNGVGFPAEVKFCIRQSLPGQTLVQRVTQVSSSRAKAVAARSRQPFCA